MSGRPTGSTSTATRILIVDDERHNRQLLEVMLAPEGFVLERRRAAKRRWPRSAQQPPDLILLDVMMPGMDGYQVAARLKGEPDDPATFRSSWSRRSTIATPGCSA